MKSFMHLWSAHRLTAITGFSAMIVMAQISSAAPTENPEPTPEEVLAAIPYRNYGTATDTALKRALENTRRQPARAALWSHLGDVLAQKQRDTSDALWYAAAQSAYQKAWRLDPTHVPALTGMAWVFGGRHEFTESVRWAKLALAADSQNPTAHGIISDAALELGDLNRALESCQQMLNARPDLSSYSRAAHLVWLRGDSRKARWLMGKAIDAGATDAENTAWCRSRLALMLFHEGALLAANQVAEQGLRLCPSHEPLLLVMGKIKLAMNQEDEAVRLFQRALESGPRHEALVALGDLHFARGRKEQAEKLYQKVEALHDTNKSKGTHDHTQMARFYTDHNRNLDLALRMAEEHGESRNVFEADALAWACFKNGDLPRARRLIQIVLAQGTPDPEMIYHAGLIAAATGDRSGAQRLLARALNLNPNFNPVHAPLAAKMLAHLATIVAAQ